MNQPIPFNRPCLAGRELELMAEAVASGHTASSGSFTRRARDLLQCVHHSEDVLLTTSCTDALEMAAMLIDVGPGDTVIAPSFTFTSTALAFARERAQLRFCDIERQTLGIDPDHLEELIDDTVRAVVVVHYAGVPCDLDCIVPLCESRGIALIEDNAHGLFATHRGQALGTFGRMSTLSFHETKNFICGEGGALVLNEVDDVERAHVLLDKGTNRQAFLDGAVDKYTWQGLGSSFGLSDILAAFLTAQLEAADLVRRSRRRLVERYRALLEPIAADFGLILPDEPVTATPADHMFYVVLDPDSDRGAVIAGMRSVGVHPTFHYVPLHSSPAGIAFSEGPQHCPVTDDVSARLLRLPFYNDMTDGDVERVVEALLDALAP
ncbi:dTDP-4-amino-4,6-dideoxygalactose transaminase [Ilumatobacter sp.]|uniref:dTDP-4-amino-4,6-dideoxygalactose transaminase n=1 Tax=Ilumatobacter sp. TaxID=1967498 RepID=UPI003C519C53